MVDQVGIHLYLLDLAGVRHHFQLLCHALEENDKAGDLDTAAGAACAGSDEHYQHHYGSGELRPEVVVNGGEAGGGDQRSHCERGVSQRLAYAAVQIRDIQRYYRGGDRHYHQERAQLKVERFLQLSGEQQKIAVEIDGEQQHEHRDDYLDIGREAAHAVVIEAEAAGAGGGKGGVQRLKHRHSSAEKHYEFHQGKHKIDGIKQHGGGAHPGHQLADRGTRALRFHDVHVLGAGKRDKRHDEHQHAHSADPVGEAPPHDGGVGQAFYVGQNAGAGGGEAGHGFKQRVDIGGDLSAENKGERTERTEQDPAQRYDNAALPGIELALFRLPEHQQSACQQRDPHSREIAPEDILAENNGGHRRGDQEHSLEQQYPAEDIRDHSVIHGRSP